MENVIRNRMGETFEEAKAAAEAIAANRQYIVDIENARHTAFKNLEELDKVIDMNGVIYNKMKVDIVYYWYHHGLAWSDDSIYKGINNTLINKDWASFQKYQKDYPDYLPNQVAIYINDEYKGKVDISENLFKTITYFESECG